MMMLLFGCVALLLCTRGIVAWGGEIRLAKKVRLIMAGAFSSKAQKLGGIGIAIELSIDNLSIMQLELRIVKKIAVSARRICVSISF